VLLNFLTSNTMKIKLLIYLLCLPLLCFGQGKYVVNNKKGVDKINFKLINNVIIIPIKVNGVELSFLLDSGVNKPIVFNFLKESNSLKILNAQTIYLKGLGRNGKVEALKSSGNTFTIGDAKNINQDCYIIYDASINFAPRLGVPIHGIIGYDLFKDLVVDINYTKRHIKLTNPDKYKYKSCKKCKTFGLEFYNNKPYVNASVIVRGNTIPVKLLVDSGSSDALWLFENYNLGLTVKNNYFNDFLGYGLSGSVHGKRSKIEAFYLKDFKFNKPLVAYPDSSYTTMVRKIKDRNGSVGGEILKRFNMTLNYSRASMVLKRNSNFKNHFSYNKVGIIVENAGIRLITEYEQKAMVKSNLSTNYINNIKISAVLANTQKYVIKKAYVIASVRDNSPASKVGLQKGDLIIKINGRDTKTYSLQEIIEKFHGKEGEKVSIEVDRFGRKIKAKFILTSFIK